MPRVGYRFEETNHSNLKAWDVGRFLNGAGVTMSAISQTGFDFAFVGPAESAALVQRGDPLGSLSDFPRSADGVVLT